jgi:hypothetical protein
MIALARREDAGAVARPRKRCGPLSRRLPKRIKVIDRGIYTSTRDRIYLRASGHIRLYRPRAVKLDLLRVFRTLVSMPASPPAIRELGLNRSPSGRSLKLFENILASMILTWKTGSRTRCRTAPVIATQGDGGYFRLANDRAGWLKPAGVAPGCSGQLNPVRSCCYSDINLGGARSS